jgi:thiol-disulfide isomerase/thioredoxin
MIFYRGAIIWRFVGLTLLGELKAREYLQKTFFEEIRKDRLLVVDFWDDWCYPCKT